MKSIQAYYEFCQRQNVEIERELQDRFYVMTDFQLGDPDGNLLTFGEKL